MSEDIVDKLMDYDRCDPDAVADEAAEYIVALRAERDELASALAESLAMNQAFRDRLYAYRMASAQVAEIYKEWLGDDE